MPEPQVCKLPPYTKWVHKTIDEAHQFYQNAERYNARGEPVAALMQYSLCANTLWNVKSILENVLLDKGLTPVLPEQGRTKAMVTKEISGIVACPPVSVGLEYQWCEQTICTLDNTIQRVLRHVQKLQGIVREMNVGGRSLPAAAPQEAEGTSEADCKLVEKQKVKQVDIDVTFDDLIGLASAKEKLRQGLVKPLIYPSLFPGLARGILLYGPPGTGKTMLAKAAVNDLQDEAEAEGGGVQIVYFAPTGAELKGKYVGETEKNITRYFTCASRIACQQNTCFESQKKLEEVLPAGVEASLLVKAHPLKLEEVLPAGVEASLLVKAHPLPATRTVAVLFIDEFDAIGGDRSGADDAGVMASSVNTLLQMMDGVKKIDNVVVIAATNYPWRLDSALLSRLQTQIYVRLPDVDDMEEMIHKLISDYVVFREPPDALVALWLGEVPGVLIPQAFLDDKDTLDKLRLIQEDRTLSDKAKRTRIKTIQSAALLRRAWFRNLTDPQCPSCTLPGKNEPVSADARKALRQKLKDWRKLQGTVEPRQWLTPAYKRYMRGLSVSGVHQLAEACHKPDDKKNPQHFSPRDLNNMMKALFQSVAQDALANGSFLLTDMELPMLEERKGKIVTRNVIQNVMLSTTSLPASKLQSLTETERETRMYYLKYPKYSEAKVPNVTAPLTHVQLNTRFVSNPADPVIRNIFISDDGKHYLLHIERTYKQLLADAFEPDYVLDQYNVAYPVVQRLTAEEFRQRSAKTLATNLKAKYANTTTWHSERNMTFIQNISRARVFMEAFLPSREDMLKDSTVWHRMIMDEKTRVAFVDAYLKYFDVDRPIDTTSAFYEDVVTVKTVKPGLFQRLFGRQPTETKVMTYRQVLTVYRGLTNRILRQLNMTFVPYFLLELWQRDILPHYIVPGEQRTATYYFYVQAASWETFYRLGTHWMYKVGSAVGAVTSWAKRVFKTRVYNLFRARSKIIEEQVKEQEKVREQARLATIGNTALDTIKQARDKKEDVKGVIYMPWGSPFENSMMSMRVDAPVATVIKYDTRTFSEPSAYVELDEMATEANIALPYGIFNPACDLRMVLGNLRPRSFVKRLAGVTYTATVKRVSAPLSDNVNSVDSYDVLVYRPREDISEGVRKVAREAVQILRTPTVTRRIDHVKGPSFEEYKRTQQPLKVLEKRDRHQRLRSFNMSDAMLRQIKADHGRSTFDPVNVYKLDTYAENPAKVIEEERKAPTKKEKSSK